MGAGPLGIDALIDISVRGAAIRLSDDAMWRQQMAGVEAQLAKALAACLLIAAQACELRGGLPRRPAVAAVVRAIRALSPAIIDDRSLDLDIEAVFQSVSVGDLGCSPGPEA